MHALTIESSFSGACSIELTTGTIYYAPSGVMKGVILTGGRAANKRVVHYDINGFVANLPDLITGRMNHACSFYYGFASVDGVSKKRRVSIYTDAQISFIFLLPFIS